MPHRKAADKDVDKLKKTPVVSPNPIKTKKSSKEDLQPKFTPVKCKVCNKECLDPEFFTSDEDDSINCDGCNHWFHKSCTDTTTAEWEALKGSNENITFRCNECLASKGQNNNQFQLFQQLLRDNNDILLKRLEGLETKILQKVDEKIEKKMVEYERKTDKTIDQKIKAQLDVKKQEQATLENAIKNQVSETLEDMRDKEERKLNLMMFNVAESTKNTLHEEVLEDLQSVKNILIHTNPELNESIISTLTTENLKRLGRKAAASTEGNTKVRPIKVTLPDETTKFKILRNSHKLKSYKTNERIGLKLDLTKLQIAEEKELKIELQRRKDLGEDVMIFRSKIIHRAEHSKLKAETRTKTPAAQPDQSQC